MFPVKFLLLVLTFYGLIVELDAIICPKGQKVKRMMGTRYTCDACPDGYYQPTENDSQKCITCRTCNAGYGSEIIQVCTKETNTKCACRAGFNPSSPDFSICKCNPGFGLKNGECSRCEDGFFTSHVNAQCRKWKECKSGVNTTGTSTKDVICNEMSNPGIKTDISFTSQRPQEETRMHTMFTTISSTTSPPTVTKQNGDSPTSANTGNHIGLFLLMFGIVGLLLLTTVTCKLHITQNVQRKPAEQTKDSVCRRPVEESGDDSELSVKLNLGEP
ncbi:tumor necrosis factor receptor superfamily member 4-like [Solea senegalensis]|uniref:Tumor necrosis factor receptor superfamily member 4-like n=1 Tax=Solea senegalensis TaxID=28829 RepID=A0AAV6QSJ7_SOLSE|nr:tumor necrosis factor receptor superfamily member 4 [Solea senegalensis]KAG7494642.1 tumor necrosis factor receptor superfamily member 4-like [Solea senegalensis]